ncbi:MAG: hypothetical protein KAI47_04950, partial [Deltaproteobacteria bacterium]|nr:hypothetical protein [Deltaproteobacteria bacterium]
VLYLLLALPPSTLPPKSGGGLLLPPAGGGIEGGKGPIIMAVDNLPCELPLESSTAFGDALASFIPTLASCDFDNNFESCTLPSAFKRATILYHGQLTPDYRYLEELVNR